jgi:hypothetical protein
MDIKSVIIKRFCTSCSRDVIDDNKGVLKPMGNRGQKRWQCSTCVSHQKKRTFIVGISSKSNAGRKPKPREDYSLCDPFEDRQLIKQIFGR